jgi:hypothetical protein
MVPACSLDSQSPGAGLCRAMRWGPVSLFRTPMPIPDPTIWAAVTGGLGAALGATAKSYFDARKVDRQKDSDDIKTLVGALITANGDERASQGRLIEKLLTDQAHLTNALDSLRRQLEEAQGRHHKCELTCSELQGRIALLERESDIGRTAAMVAGTPAAVVVVKGEGGPNAPTT